MKELIIGIDDAGRGPVIGPMTLSGALIEKSMEPEFLEAGVADSKTLTPKKRAVLEKLIKEKSLAFHIETASPAEIDTGMGVGLNLNQVEAMMASLVIKNLLDKVDEKEKVKIVIDCPSNNTDGWKKQLMGFVVKHNLGPLNVSCEHKADRDHVAVAAGSILSKEKREQEMAKLREQIGKDCGSGYPNDPKTKTFLAENHGNYKKEHIFRESWATYKKAVSGKNQAKLPDY